MSRRRRDEDDFAAEQPWPAENDAGRWPPEADDAGPWPPEADDAGRWPPEADDDAGRWPPEAGDAWPDHPGRAPGGGRRGRHSAQPGPPAGPGGWEPAAGLPRPADQQGRPVPGTSPGWEDPGWGDPGQQDRYARQEPDPPPSRRAAPWERDPRAGDPYPGSAASDGLAGGQYAGPAGGERGGPPGGGRSRTGRSARYGDPGGQYGSPGGQYGDPDAFYGDPEGQPGDRARGYGDPGYGDPPEWPDAPSGLRPGSRGGYPGAGDGYPAPGRGGTGGQPGGPRSGRPATGYGSQDRDPAAPAPGDRGTARGRAAERDDPGWDDEDGYQDEGWPFGGGGDGDSGRRPRRKRRGRWAGPSSLLIVAAIILIPLIIGGIYAYRVIAAHYDPPNYSGAGTGTVIFQVKPGDTSQTVGDRLVTDGVVASSRALVLAAEHSANTNLLQPGYFRLHKHMNAQLAWNLLVSPAARVQLKVTIPEGWRVTQIVAALSKQSGIPASDYTKALKDTKALGLPSYAKGNPEGYLFPATYDIPPHSTATSVLRSMVAAFNQEAASVNLPKAAAHGHLSPAEAIVVASLAQAEGGKTSDFPKITRVIYNRLNAHMPLELDSTVLYALHTYGILASNQQLKVKSPYNTYAHQGLPPGPIDSPGNAAIQAALHPASGNWLYFVTVNPKTKQTDFTSSPAVFQQLKNQLQQNLAHGG